MRVRVKDLNTEQLERRTYLLEEGVPRKEIMKQFGKEADCAKYGHFDFEYWSDGVSGCRHCGYTRCDW